MTTSFVKRHRAIYLNPFRVVKLKISRMNNKLSFLLTQKFAFPLTRLPWRERGEGGI
jgi:hypothetical protein